MLCISLAAVHDMPQQATDVIEHWPKLFIYKDIYIHTYKHTLSFDMKIL